MAFGAYVAIPIREFLTGMRSPADLYIQLSQDRFVLLFKESDPFDPQRIEAYVKKEISCLWVKKEEYHKISSSSLDFARRSINNTNLDSSKKLFLVSNAAQAVFRNFEVLGFNIDSYYQANDVSETTLAIADNNPDLNSILSSLNDLDDHLVMHATAVSILSPIIGQEMGWETITSLKKLSLGGLLHDIGKKHLHPNLLKKPLHEMNHEEVKAYESHTRLGAEMIKGLNLVNEDLVAIIFQHHERNNSSGYPQGLAGFRIHPMAKVVGLASEFISLVMPQEGVIQKKYTPEEALRFIQNSMGQPFDKDTFSALDRVVNRPGLGNKRLKAAA
jgi:putative nucleotidyltransferase with HDIG domain